MFCAISETSIFKYARNIPFSQYYAQNQEWIFLLSGRAFPTLVFNSQNATKCGCRDAIALSNGNVVFHGFMNSGTADNKDVSPIKLPP
jgi:hypothetical protein